MLIPGALAVGQARHDIQLVAAGLGLYVAGKQGVQLELLVEPALGLYVPDGQAEHWPCPANALNVPAAQSVQEDEPPLLQVPEGHDMQLALPVDPRSGLYVPVGHGVQFACGSTENVPGRHSRHANPLMKVPLGHDEHVACPSLEKFPPAHDVQFDMSVAPASGFDVPAGHGVHLSLPWEGLKAPAGHKAQLARPVEPMFGFAVPAGHGVQFVANAAPRS